MADVMGGEMRGAEVDGLEERPVEWTIVVVNHGWGGPALWDQARRRARGGDGATMLLYVVREGRHPRRVWLGHARRALQHAVGAGGAGLASSLLVSRSVLEGVRLVASGTGGAVAIRLGDSRHQAQLSELHVPYVLVDSRASVPATHLPDGSPRRRLLVPFDGTAATRAALERAAQLARGGDEVNVLNVMPEPGVSSRIGPHEREHRRQDALLEEARRVLADHGVEGRCIASVGGAAAQTLAVAERLGADVIVVGAQPGGLLRGCGSLSDRLARRARCEVLVVRDS